MEKSTVVKMYKGSKVVLCDTDPFFGQVEKYKSLGYSSKPAPTKVAAPAPEAPKPAEKVAKSTVEVKEGTASVEVKTPRLKTKKIKK